VQRRVSAASRRDSHLHCTGRSAVQVSLPKATQNDKYTIVIKKNAHPNRDERDARGTTLIPALAV